MIDFCYNDFLYEKGIKKFIPWEFEKNPHIAISGITGTGKTVLQKILMLSLLMNSSEHPLITICDFKGSDDYLFLEGHPEYYRFSDVQNGFDDFYEKFEERQANPDTPKVETFLFFDEWSSFLNHCEKKEADSYRQKLSNILMLGRSLGVHVVLSQQRLDAESFGKSRDNFSIVVVLGNPSKEVIGMLLSDFKDEISSNKTKGCGYLLKEGSELKHIRVPHVRNIDELNNEIRIRL